MEHFETHIVEGKTDKKFSDELKRELHERVIPLRKRLFEHQNEKEKVNLCFKRSSEFFV